MKTRKKGLNWEQNIKRVFMYEIKFFCSLPISAPSKLCFVLQSKTTALPNLRISSRYTDLGANNLGNVVRRLRRVHPTQAGDGIVFHEEKRQRGLRTQ